MGIMKKSRVGSKRKVLQDGMSLANEKQLLAMTARVRCLILCLHKI